MTKFLRGTGVLAVCVAISLAAAGEEVRLVPVFRAGGTSGLTNVIAHDLDGDGKRELVTCSNGSPMAFSPRDGTYVATWHAAGSGCSSGVAAGDLDGDGGAEVVAASGTRLLFFDPRGLGGPSETLTIPGSSAITAIAIGNVDGDATQELVAVTSGATYIYDGATDELQWTATGYGGSSVRIGDVDGDNGREIVVNGSTAYVLDAMAENQKWGYVGGFSNAWALGNVDADAKDEIVFRSGGSVIIFNGDTFTSSSWSNSYVDALSVADADDDGTNEIIVGSYYEDVTGRNAATGAELWRIDNNYTSVMSVQAVDLDADGRPEVFWAHSNSIVVGDAAVLQPEWRSIVSSGRHHSAFGDLDGDGRLEYVLGAAQSPLIQVFDAETRLLLRTLPTTNFSSYLNGLAIGQLDNDAALEVAALLGYSGTILVTWDGITGQQEFSSNSNSSLGSVMTVANIDADAVDEVLIGANDQHVLVLNGASNIIQKSLSISGYPYGLALADLNGDTTRDLVVSTSSTTAVYDMTSWAQLGSAPLSYGMRVAATSADGGTVAVATDSYVSLHVFKGAALSPAYTCSTFDTERVAFAGAAGEERLLVANEGGEVRIYPLDGESCPEELEPVFAARSIADLTVLDVTGDGRQDVIIDSYGATTVALLGFSSEARGDVDGDGVITVDDIDDAVDYLFGAEPGIAPSADATADERISSEDILMLIHHEFTGGAAPLP